MGGADGNKDLIELVRKQMSVGFDESGQKFHCCRSCNFRAKVTSNLRSHVEANHMGDMMYTCQVCGETKKTWQTLQNHARKTHGLSPHNDQPITSVSKGVHGGYSKL